MHRLSDQRTESVRGAEVLDVATVVNECVLAREREAFRSDPRIPKDYAVVVESLERSAECG